MDLTSVQNAYRRHAPYYDAVFGVLLHPGRRRTVALANRVASARVLEVGVGTGLSLPAYRRGLSIVGIDVSVPMLEQARRRVRAAGLGNVEALIEMDAENLRFPDNSFDTVIAMYVASVVPNPKRLLQELQRVCRPDGRILIVNHFAATSGLRAAVERWLSGWSRKLGWRPDFALDTVTRQDTLEVMESTVAPPFGLFTVLHCRNAKGPSVIAASGVAAAGAAEQTEPRRRTENRLSARG